MRIVAMPGPFGAFVEAIDLRRAPDDDAARALVDALHTHQILVFRGQDLTKAQFVAFGDIWGDPLAFYIDSYREADFPQIIRIDNRASTLPRYRNTSAHWHADSSYEEVPASVTMLHGIEAPRQGGETLFASAVHAFDALDAETRKEIDGLTALHCLGGSPALAGETVPFIAEATARHGITRHPMVMPHPVTGRKAIYTSGTAFSAKGLDLDRGRALVLRLRAHVADPRFRTSHKVEAGDIVVWDNFQVVHRASEIEYSDDDGKRRIMHRISTKGMPRVYQNLEPAVAQVAATS